MWKRLVILAVLLTVAQAAMPATGETTDNSADNRHTQNQSANARNNPSAGLAPLLEKENNGQTLKPESDKGPSNHDQPTINVTNLAPVPVPWGLREWFAWGANLVLVAVGIGGVVLAICTLGVIKRQTNVLSAAMNQWVVLDGWGSEESVSGLTITFNLVNPTNYLIVLNHAEVEFSPEIPGKRFLVRRDTLLAPNRPIGMKLFLPLTPERINTFKTDIFGIVVKGRIVFGSALGEEITQQIDGVLTCNVATTSFESTATLRPTTGKDAKRDKK